MPLTASDDTLPPLVVGRPAAHGAIAPTELRRLARDGMQHVRHDVDVRLAVVVVTDDQGLVLREPESGQRLARGRRHVCRRRPVVGMPRQHKMERQTVGPLASSSAMRRHIDKALHLLGGVTWLEHEIDARCKQHALGRRFADVVENVGQQVMKRTTPRAFWLGVDQAASAIRRR